MKKKTVVPVVTGSVYRFHTGECFTTILVVGTGPKWIRYITMDSSGLRIKRVKRSLNEMHMAGLDYPMKRMKQKLRSAAKRFGITKTAARAIA